MNSVRTQRVSATLRWMLALGLGLASGVAHAEPSEADKQSAGEKFERGVELFEAADYAAAARAFLQADQLAPSDEAVSNAMSAARKANDHLLAAKAAQQALSRSTTAAQLKQRAGTVMAEATPHLARLELDCDPKPCDLALDGASVAPGLHFLLPGTHSLLGKSGDQQARQRVQFDANTAYRIVMHPAAGDDATQVATQPAPAAQPQSATTPAAPQPPAPHDRAEPAGLSPTWFYVGAALTVALAGVTTWSGFDTLGKKTDLGDAPTQAQVDDVQSRIRRTDYLLAGTAVAAGVTAVVGLTLVDWEQPVSAAVAGGPGGGFGVIRGRF